MCMLKPQDIVILLKIIAIAHASKSKPGVWTQAKLAIHLCMSPSEVNAGIKRLYQSGLLGLGVGIEGSYQKNLIPLPIKAACEECLIYGVKYFFPIQLAAYTRGIATSYAAPIFTKHISIGNDPIPVWPYAEGEQRGLALEPLYRSVPQSIAEYPDQVFYELLTLIDTIRTGRARERNIAINLLKERINYE